VHPDLKQVRTPTHLDLKLNRVVIVLAPKLPRDLKLAPIPTLLGLKLHLDLTPLVALLGRKLAVPTHLALKLHLDLKPVPIPTHLGLKLLLDLTLLAALKVLKLTKLRLPLLRPKLVLRKQLKHLQQQLIQLKLLATLRVKPHKHKRLVLKSCFLP